MGGAAAADDTTAKTVGKKLTKKEMGGPEKRAREPARLKDIYRHRSKRSLLLPKLKGILLGDVAKAAGVPRAAPFVFFS